MNHDDTTVLRAAKAHVLNVFPPAMATLVHHHLRQAADNPGATEQQVVQLAHEILGVRSLTTQDAQATADVIEPMLGDEDERTAARQAIAEAGTHVDRLIGKYRDRAVDRGPELALCDLSALCTVTPVLRRNAPALLAVAVGRLATRPGLTIVAGGDSA